MRTRASLSALCILLGIAPSASAEFVGVSTVNTIDPDTELLCVEGHGDNVPGPLTVCNVFATFTHPGDRLLSVGNAGLQVYNGAIPDVFFHHPVNARDQAPWCSRPAVP